MNLPEHKDVPKPTQLPVRLQVSAIDYDDKGLFIELRKDDERFEFGIGGIRKSQSVRSDLRPVELVAPYIKYHGRKGLFHGFFEVKDGDDGGPVAIVELDDGNIIEVVAYSIRFLDRITLIKDEDDETNK